MKHLILVTFFFLCSCHLYPQQGERIVEDGSPAMWRDRDISAYGPRVFASWAKVLDADLDEKTMILYAVVQRISEPKRPQGGARLIAYSLTKNELIWVYEFGNKPARYVRIDTIPMITTAQATWAIHPHTGAGLWSASLEVSKEMSSDNTLAVGYESWDRNTHYIKGLDPLTGQLKWLYMIDKPSPAGVVAMRSDTALYLLDNSLRQIDLQNGNAHYYSIFNYPAFGSAMIASAKKESLLGEAMTFVDAGSSTSAHALGRKLVNLALHDGLLYHAGAGTVKALTAKGEELWTFISPRELSGISKLFFHAAHLYLVNYGTIPGSGKRESGELYIAKLNPADGTLLAGTGPGALAQVKVKDFLVLDSSMQIITNNRMAEVDLNNLEILEDKPFGEAGMIEGIRLFIKPPYFIYDEGKLENISLLQPDLVLMQFSLAFNLATKHCSSLNTPVSREDLFTFTRQTDHGMHLSNGEELLIVDKGDRLLPIRFGAHMRMYEEYLVDWGNNRILVMPLEALGGLD